MAKPSQAMHLRCVTPPEDPPVTLAQAKAWLHIDGEDENALIWGLIAAAAGHLDGPKGVLRRALEPQTWEMTLDGFSDPIRLPLGPVVSVTSIAWEDVAGATHALASSAWRLRHDARGAFLAPVSSWPSGVLSVTVEWVAGEGCPEPVRHAILMLVAHYYANREAVGAGGAGAAALVELPLGVAKLIAPWKVFT